MPVAIVRDVVACRRFSTDANTSRISTALPEAGQYSVVVTSYNPNASGTFSLSVNSLGVGAAIPQVAASGLGEVVAEATSTLSGLTRMGVSSAPPIQGTATQGELTSGENTAPLPQTVEQSAPQYLRDVYPIMGAPGQMVSIDVMADFDCMLLLIAPDGTVLAENDDFEGTNHSRLAEVPFAQAGNHTAVVTSYAPNVTGRYTITIGNPVPALTVSPDVPLATGQQLSGTLSSEDHAALPLSNERHGSEYWRDGYSVAGSPNTGLMVDVAADFDAYLLLLDPAGNVIAANDDYGDVTKSHVQANLAQAGTYRVIVTSLNPGVGGTYTITSSQPPPPSADTPITLGQIVQGALEATDRAALPATDARGNGQYMTDGYAFSGSAGQPVQVDVTAQFDAFIYLLGPSGEVITSNDDFGTSSASRISVTLTETGPHRIVVTSYDENTAGTYTVTVQQPAQDTSATQPLPLGSLQIPAVPASPDAPVPAVAPFSKE